MKQLLERQIEQSCSEWLQLDGWRPLKTDPVSDSARGKGFGEKGMADRLYIRYRPQPGPTSGCRKCGCMPCACSLGGPHVTLGIYCEASVLWIEWKRLTKGGKPTKAAPHQKTWHAAERARGATVWIAGEDFPASIEGFQEYYRRSGLRRSVR